MSPKPAFELEMSRVIDAPRARVYAAWTNSDQIMQWFAPRPFTLVISRMDFRPGGTFSMAMRSPDGSDFPFSGIYREVSPARISWAGEFSSDGKDEVSTVVTMEEDGQKTRLHVRQTFHRMTPEIERATKGAKQGWGTTLEQLNAFCA